MTPTLVPATQAMLKELGERPKGTGRAYAAVMEGRTLGVCGYYQDHGRLVLYAQVTPELRRWKKVILRGAKMTMAAADRLRAPVVAMAQPDVPGSDRTLIWLGFEHVEEELYWRPTWRLQP